MKAAFVLIANSEAEYLARRIMLEAHKLGDLGFEAARLPHHVSLKQPFEINDLEDIESFFQEFARTLKPIEIELMEVECLPSTIFGYASGLLWFHARKTPELKNIHFRLNDLLEEKYDNTKAVFDGEEYEFHMTISIGKASYENYNKAFHQLNKKSYFQTFVFDEIGLFYYDDDYFKQGTYYCYKRLKLT